MGKGQAMVLLHGFLGSSDNMLSIGKRFEDRYEVFMPDLRNHGHSPHHNTMTYSVMSDDLKVFFEENKITSSVLLGHSMGGKVAMQFALDNPEKVSKLIVVDIGLKRYALSSFEYVERINDLNINNITSRKELEDLFDIQIKEKNIVKLLLKNIERSSNNTLRWRINIKAFNSNILDEIQSKKIYNKPMLLVKGALSDYLNEADLHDLKIPFPIMKSEIVPDSGHWVHVDNLGCFIQVLEKFI